jgi:DNA-binding MarR family transcriptional regulator
MGTPMVESQTLKLVLAASSVTEQISHYLSQTLQGMGYEGASSSVLLFLSALDCGINYGSEIARSLNVSRQMVAKTVKQLSTLGYLQQIEGQGKQKQIVFTQRGELLMADSRLLLAKLDSKIASAVDEDTWSVLLQQLDQLSVHLKQSCD